MHTEKSELHSIIAHMQTMHGECPKKLLHELADCIIGLVRLARPFLARTTNGVRTNEKYTKRPLNHVHSCMTHASECIIHFIIIDSPPHQRNRNRITAINKQKHRTHTDTWLMVFRICMTVGWRTREVFFLHFEFCLLQSFVRMHNSMRSIKMDSLLCFAPFNYLFISIFLCAISCIRHSVCRVLRVCVCAAHLFVRCIAVFRCRDTQFCASNCLPFVQFYSYNLSQPFCAKMFLFLYFSLAFGKVCNLCECCLPLPLCVCGSGINVMCILFIYNWNVRAKKTMEFAELQFFMEAFGQRTERCLRREPCKMGARDMGNFNSNLHEFLSSHSIINNIIVDYLFMQFIYV